MESIRILLVGDEPDIVRPIRRNLLQRGYEVSLALDLDDTLYFLSEEFISLCIIKLDFHTQPTDGLDIVKSIRTTNNVPIIVLSTVGSENKKISALDMGADDYLVIPFDMGEFLARVRATLSRYLEQDATAENKNRQIIISNQLYIDLGKRDVRVKGKEIHLTPTEFDLLAYMTVNRDRVLTHKELLKEVWGLDFSNNRAYLRVFISQLRQKIEVDASRPKYLITEPRLGYRFVRD